MKVKKPTGRVRLVIDFEDSDQLLDFVDMVKLAAPESTVGADAYAMDGLDERSITQANTFLFKRGRDRIPGTCLRDIVRPGEVR